MFEFIRIQYVLGKIAKEQINTFVPRWISEEQAEKILEVIHEESLA